ncbi:proteasome complex subunit Rpn13 ubiquitin receptor-domain-containing protein [Terfezia claveryi]|nr:proteasome complex subunit Rpn13 ubiquitin receptor-domain-containing protein [Terfezia claveryi]
MSANVRPLISIKAGKCRPSPTDPKTIVPDPTAGILYLYNNPEDELLHLCWKPRDSPDPPTPENDLLIIPYDATFVAFPIPTGRIYILKFSSSLERHFYWLQSKPEKADDPGFFSARDREVGRVINRLLQGDEVADDSEDLLGDDEDETMEDVERRDDGSESREGGADGGRAPTTVSSTATSAPALSNLPRSSTGAPSDPSNFLQSLISSISVPPTVSQASATTPQAPVTLPLLLTPATSVELLLTLSEVQMANLLALLPPQILPSNPSPADQQRVLEKVLRSPQFVQSLASLTGALRDEGGLRGICEAVGVDIGVVAGEVWRNGGDLVAGFVEGVRKQVEKEERDARDRMEE